MKKIVSFLLLSMLLLALSVPGLAGDGTWSNDAKLSTGFAGEKQGAMRIFTCIVDSVDTLTSETFSLARYDGYAVHADSATGLGQWIRPEVPAGWLATSSAGTPKVTAYVQGSYDESNWFNVDTVATDLTAETLQKGTLQLLRYLVPYYRVVVYGVATNNPDTVFDLRLYLYWPLDSHGL